MQVSREPDRAHPLQPAWGSSSPQVQPCLAHSITEAVSPILPYSIYGHTTRDLGIYASIYTFRREAPPQRHSCATAGLISDRVIVSQSVVGRPRTCWSGPLIFLRDR